jgi:hypothetical protein
VEFQQEREPSSLSGQRYGKLLILLRAKEQQGHLAQGLPLPHQLTR